MHHKAGCKSGTELDGHQGVQTSRRIHAHLCRHEIRLGMSSLLCLYRGRFAHGVSATSCFSFLFSLTSSLSCRNSPRGVPGNFSPMKSSFGRYGA
eukprot:3864198-Amphidinium_carterae.1